MNGLSEYFKSACQELSEGMKPGAYKTVKKAFPKFFDQVNEKLDDNFTIKGVDEYKETMIRGFKKCNMWSN